MNNKKKKITFSVDTIELIDLDSVNDSQFAKGRLKCFASGMTSHNYAFSEEVLKSAESTILAKPLLWAYDIFKDDAKGHETCQIPCGFVPDSKDNANISYGYSEDGRLFLYVDVWIWKLYCGRILDIFKKTDGCKDVSVELWVLEQEDHEDYIDVLLFAYTGITILGEDVSPAVKDAQLQIVQFSEAKNLFTTRLYNQDEESASSDSFFNAKKEENMDLKTAKNSNEVLENAKKVTRTNVTVSQDTDLYTDDGDFIANEYESHYKSKTETEEVPDDNTIENSSDSTIENEENKKDTACNSEEKISKDDYDSLVLKCTELENTVKENNLKLESLHLKCSELEAFKRNTLEQETKQVVECALNDVSNILSASDLDDWRKKSLQCQDATAFNNELKAYAWDVQKRNGVKETETLRNSLPLEEKTISDNIWDRLESQL